MKGQNDVWKLFLKVATLFHKVFSKLRIQCKTLTTMEDSDRKALDDENSFSAEIP